MLSVIMILVTVGMGVFSLLTVGINLKTILAVTSFLPNVFVSPLLGLILGINEFDSDYNIIFYSKLF